MEAGTYAPIFFIPGWHGLIYSEWYSTVLAKFAGYGYIVAAVDPHWPILENLKRGAFASGKSAAEPELMFEDIQWVRMYACVCVCAYVYIGPCGRNATKCHPACASIQNHTTSIIFHTL